MYERMLDKGKAPCEADLRAYIGEAGCTRLAELERILSQQYALKRDLRFPFGNSYGWGYKYSHKSAHLCSMSLS